MQHGVSAVQYDLHTINSIEKRTLCEGNFGQAAVISPNDVLFHPKGIAI
ncbi:hypothetical protein [Metabacillus idriensis]|nr:hypothetical protein [Metabacillus idriensis]